MGPLLGLECGARLVGGLGRERGERGEGSGSLKEGLEGAAEKRYLACDVTPPPPPPPPERAASMAGGIGEEESKEVVCFSEPEELFGGRIRRICIH